MKRLTTISALALAALALATGCSGGAQDRSGDAATAAAESPPAKGAADATGGSEDLAVAAPGLPRLDAKVVKTASLDLVVPRGDFDETIARVRDEAARLGGFVVSSETDRARAGRPQRGTMTVRVPARAYAQAMRALEGLGRVEGRRESSTDVSAEYVDLEARIRHLEAVERRLLELLERADTVAAALSVQTTLNDTQLQLEEARGRLRYLDDQTAYATVSLAIAERSVVAASGDGWGIVSAWRDGARAFVSAASLVFVAAAIVAPLVLLLGAVLLAIRFTRRLLRLRTS